MLLRFASICNSIPFTPRSVRLVVASAVAMLLSGCAAMDTATSIYNTAKGGTELYHSATSIKDLTNFNPAFQGFSSVLVLADIRPREESPEAPTAFAQNMAFFTGSVARTVRAPLQVCYVMNQCAGRLRYRTDSVLPPRYAPAHFAATAAATARQ